MAEDVEISLCELLVSTEFSLQINELKLSNNKALLLAYVRDRLHQSLQYVISAVNKIRSNSLNNRLLTKLYKENDEEFNHLFLHIEVRWLSKSACLNRFWNLFDSVLEFLEEKDIKLKNSQFPVLADLHKNSEIAFDNIQVYCQHLESLHMDFSERFKDILSLEVPQ
ncbi:hypothetical protein QTP88_001590 [Uroleucon formosanum]